ncbi:hypothetical protein IKE83_02410 [Candidatus Saccharibacteria bacterium]|nr:hypothetical protein [Candidatus Saccharibacteria bacterium]
MEDEKLEKYEQNPYSDLYWNLPEQKQGVFNVIGGHGGSFRAPLKVAERLTADYPLKTVNLVLPEVLRGKVPDLPNFVFLPATGAGSFAEGEGILRVMEGADYNLLVGDLSKNSITVRAVAGACESSEKPLLITRDAVDLIAENGSDEVLMRENVTIMGSLAQFQKLLRAIYYPKMLTLSQSLVQVVEILHKLTISYPAEVVTFYNGLILAAKDGEVGAVPLEKTGYSVLTLWGGELAGRIGVMQMFNPGKPYEATVTGLFRG